MWKRAAIVGSVSWREVAADKRSEKVSEIEKNRRGK
jgi:hypothetical protein